MGRVAAGQGGISLGGLLPLRRQTDKLVDLGKAQFR
jgi:hypothetical protein